MVTSLNLYFAFCDSIMLGKIICEMSHKIHIAYKSWGDVLTQVVECGSIYQ